MIKFTTASGSFDGGIDSNEILELKNISKGIKLTKEEVPFVIIFVNISSDRGSCKIYKKIVYF